MLFYAYLLDAATRHWVKGGKDSKRKALTVSLGIVAPMLLTTVYSQLAAFGVMTGRAPNGAWMLGALVTMAYEWGRNIRREWLGFAGVRGLCARADSH